MQSCLPCKMLQFNGTSKWAFKSKAASSAGEVDQSLPEEDRVARFNPWLE